MRLNILFVCSHHDGIFIFLLISQAFDAKNSLASQRASLSNSTGGLTNISSSVPGISRIIDGIQKKKFRESLVLTLVIATLICFAIW